MSFYYGGIDPSISNTGVVILDPTGAPVLFRGTSEDLTKKDVGHKILRYQIISDLVKSYIVTNTNTYLDICYEDYSFDSVNKSYSIGEMGGVLKSTILGITAVGIRLYLVPPSTLKLFATGYGGATKEMMGKKFKGDNPSTKKAKSDDVVDAFYLALMAQFIGGVFNSKDKELLRHRLTIVNTYLKQASYIANYK